jgi:membrane protease YdiL (CAAX protease family)
MKKVGEFFACFLPLLGFLAIQVGVAMIGTIVKGVSLAMQGVTSADALEEALLGSDYLMKITIVSQLVCFIIFLIFYRVIFKIKKPESPAKVFSATSPLLIIVLFVAVEAITSSILIKVSVLIPDLMQQYAEMIEKSGLADMTVLSTIATLVLAPLGEELAFRGMTLNLAGKFTKKFWIANIIQAAMFGIAHMNIVQGTYAFVLGLVLGFIYKKYNSLYATMIAHLAFNFSGTYLVGLLFGTEDDVPIIRWIVVLAAATVICAFAFVAVLRDKKTFEREPMYMKRIHFRKEMPAAYAAAGVPVNTTPVNTTDTFNNNGQL